MTVLPALQKSDDKEVTGLSHVITDYLQKYFDAHGVQSPAPGLYQRLLREIERPLIVQTLIYVDGSKGRAAEILGMNRNTLRKKIQDLDIKF